MMIVILFFGEFYNTDNYCNDITRNTINEYIIFLRKKSTVNEITINSYLRGIRAWFYFCMKLSYIEKFEINLLKITKNIKETFTDEELTLLLKKPDITKTTFSEYRNWVVSNYLLGTGNRLSTVCNIKIGDIDFTNSTIILKTTKNRKQQIIPITTSLQIILTEYLKYRKGDSYDYLFCSVFGKQLKTSALQSAIKGYNRKRGVIKTSIHLYRHTFAKKWILKGGDIFRLQRILGHSSIEMVKEYVNMFSEDLKIGFAEFNPLEDFSNIGKRTIKMK